MEKRNGVYLEIAGDLKDIAIKKKSAQDAILNCIRQNPSIRQFEIAAQLERTKQNVNRAVRKLLRDGYITRSADNRYKVVKTLWLPWRLWLLGNQVIKVANQAVNTIRLGICAAVYQ